MRERPILLNAEMVLAVLAGSKTQTRRVIKFPLRDKNFGCELSGNELAGEVSAGNYRNCPFGTVGDRLWVREKTRVDLLLNNRRAHVRYEADGEYRIVPVPERIKPMADGRCMSNGCYREASRITLEITGVRVERLKSISEEDAQAEGVQQLRGGFWRHYNPGWTQHQLSARGSFLTLWDSIYGEESSQANPWVWVIEFKRVEDSPVVK